MSRPKAKKTPLALVPPIAIIHAAEAFDAGNAGRVPYDFREKSLSAMEYLSKAMRHIIRVIDGEEKDRDTNRHHLGHAIADLAVYLDAEARGNLSDDRPNVGKGPASDALAIFEELRKVEDGGAIA